MIATIRAAVAAWLETEEAGSDYVSAVYATPPRIVSGTEFEAPGLPTSGAGAVVFVYIETGNQQLITMGGPTSGVYSGQYTCHLIVAAQDATGNTAHAQKVMDETMGELTRAIMANRTANTTDGTVFMWGLGPRDGSGVDIAVQMELPRTYALRSVLIWGTLTVTVQELTQQGATI